MIKYITNFSTELLLMFAYYRLHDPPLWTTTNNRLWSTLIPTSSLSYHWCSLMINYVAHLSELPSMIDSDQLYPAPLHWATTDTSFWSIISPTSPKFCKVRYSPVIPGVLTLIRQAWNYVACWDFSLCIWRNWDFMFILQCDAQYIHL